jgi:hypothetical protein
MEPKSKFLLGALSLILLVIVGFLYMKYFNNDKTNNDKTNSKETYEIRENFPQKTSVNLLYTDQNGNLGATSDLGINNLSVFNGSNLKGGVSVDTLNATSITSPTITASTSITSPTIDNLQSQINSLNTALTNLTTNFNYLNNKAMTTDTNYYLYGNANGIKKYYLSDGYTPRADGLGTNYGSTWFFKTN